jgi:hypothetical protein
MPSKHQRKKVPLAHSFGWFILGLLFDSEVGGYMSLRNVDLYPKYTALELDGRRTDGEIIIRSWEGCKHT